MAYGHANVGATELADLARDMPLIGANVIPTVPLLESWNQLGTNAATDETASGFPVARAHDADPELITKPDAAQSLWYINYRFGIPVDIDFVAIGPGHNLGASALTGLAIEFDKNSDGLFTDVDSCDLVGAFPTTNDDRIMQLDLDITGDLQGTPQRFTDVIYCRLRMQKGSGFVPNITELILGTRYQIPRSPNGIFNPENIGDIAESADPTKGGSIDKTIRAENQFILDAEWTIVSDETARLKDVWKKMKGALVWCWEPSSAPASYHLMTRDNDRLMLPYVGWQTRTLTLEATEQGPESKYLDNEP